MEPRSFLYELDEATGVATITLNRPDRLNALTFEVYQELRDAFVTLDTEPGVRSILLTGSGRAFCSGGDVEDIIGDLFQHDYQGLMTQVGSSDQQSADISQGWPMLQRVVSLDIGQSIAICGGEVIAVESLEGTDAMIERAGGLNGSGWTLLKAPAEDHDMRFDVPAIGPTTIERMARARGGCLALHAGRVIMIEKERVLATAERLGIPIIGIGN